MVINYLALYRKYRPSTFDDVVGQEENIKILTNAVLNNMISHAYIFYGPRGTGKTTMAKIFSKMINCESLDGYNPCCKCKNCLDIFKNNDVVEIDAASNNGVDEIRELRDKANLVPSLGKYKIYIIDEVHMLTTQAFNALLKTIEEPPKHVIFILATTEIHKIPLTILSRCQKFQFTKLDNDEIVMELRKIANLENIDVGDDSLYEIARLSNGGMRDSINFLDQLRTYANNSIKLEDVFKVCGTISYIDIKKLFIDIYNNDVVSILNFVNDVDRRGINYIKIIEELMSFLRDVLLCLDNVDTKYISTSIDEIRGVANLFSKEEVFYIFKLLDKLFENIRFSTRPAILLTTFLLKLTEKNFNKSDNYGSLDMLNSKFVSKEGLIVDNSIDNTVNESQKIVHKIDNVNNDSLDVKCILGEEDKKIIINNAFALADKKLLNFIKEKWSVINDYLSDKKYSKEAGLLLDVTVRVAGNGYVIVSTKYDSLIDKFYSNYDIIIDFIVNIFEKKYFLVLVDDLKWNELKKEYVDKINSGLKYDVMEFNYCGKKSNDIINNLSNSNKIDKLIDLIGEDVIEYK